MNKREKSQRLCAVMDRLEQVYPTAECALSYQGDPWKLLVMGRLSAQCTDKRVNIVSKELFSKYPTAKALADGELSEIEQIIKPCGLYRMKAANIKEASRMLVDEYSGVLPSTMEELLRFEGVGRKIANLLLGDIYGLDAVVCDTHCIRICGRLGMYPESEKNPEKIERILRGLMDTSRGSDFCHRIVILGREFCLARGQRCSECPIADLCEKNLREKAKSAKGGRDGRKES